MNLPANALARLFFRDGRELTYRRGDTIIREGDTPSGVYFIVSGWVKVYSLCGDGDSNIVMSLHPGDMFPLAWAVTNVPQNVTFSALDISHVMRLPRDLFVAAIKTDNAVAQAALLSLASYSTRLTDELENLHYRSARERVAFRLIALADYFGSPGDSQATINVRIPNEYIARSTNMTRETASREMSRLAQKKLIFNVEGHIVIPNMHALEREAGKGFSLSLARLKHS